MPRKPKLDPFNPPLRIDKGIIFLLGAGASVDAGVPPASQVAFKVKTILANRSGSSLFNQLYDAMSVNGKSPSIEDLLLVLDFFIDPYWSPMAPFVSRRYAAFKANKEDLRRLVASIQQAAIELAEPSTPCDYLARLAHFLSTKKTTRVRRTEVFTLNYDCLVEAACVQNGVNCWTGFEDVTSYDPPYTFFSPRVFDKPGVSLYKLHGSTRWGTLTSSRQSRSSVACGRLPASEMKRRTRMSINPWGAAKGIILGWRDKAKMYPPYIDLQRIFNQSLDNALAVVVIGYSWNDEYINERIKTAAGMRSQVGVPLLIVDVNPSIPGNADHRSIPTLHVKASASHFLADKENALKVPTMGRPRTESVNGLRGVVNYVASSYLSVGGSPMHAIGQKLQSDYLL